MRIVIDARFYGPEGTGIGRYVENLVRYLERLDSQNEYFIILKKSNFHLYQPAKPNFQKILVDAHWYSAKEQLLLPSVLRRIKPDLVHFTHFNVPLLYSGKFVVTIHDITKTKLGKQAARKQFALKFLLKEIAYKITFGKALKGAEKILVPSEFVKNELIQTAKLDQNKIIVSYEGADDFKVKKTSFSQGKVDQLLAQIGIKKPFVLYVGNTFPYKNVSKLPEALLSVDSKVKLLIVSPRNKFLEDLEEQVKNLGIKQRVVFQNYITTEDLKILYLQAECFVFPSISEGFGLPGLEAMAVGCPVLAANQSSFPEIYGEAALYFDPNSVSDIAEKINKVLRSRKLHDELSTLGLEQAKKYSWEKMALETLKVYEEVLA